MAERYDLIIIGSGPAGLAAAIYAQRARLHTLVLEKEMVSGGQVLNTYEVDNYPGMPGISGFELGTKMREHADKLETKFVTDEVREISLVSAEALDELQQEKEESGADKLQAAQLRPVSGGGAWKQVSGKKGTYLAKAVIIASGATHSKLGIPGEEALAGMGVSYCATCDGAFFRGRKTAVIGGGDVAIEDAIFLARMCEHVWLIHRRDELRGAKSLQEALFALPNVTIIWDTVAESIEGTEAVEALALKNVKTGEQSRLEVDGVFIAVGITPNSQPYQELIETERGYLRAGEDCATSVPGIYAAGDVRTKQLRQIVTAVADGANAVTSVERYLTQN